MQTTTAIKVRKSNERGQADHGWLQSRHSFSFGDYYDPQHSSFRSLRVINEDHVDAEQGFGLHPHQNMEIISYVISGSLEHQDSMGNKATLKAGDVQHISAGKGIRHQEYNPSKSESVHFLQIWIQPESKGTEPSYAEKSFGEIEPNRLHQIASKQGKENSLLIGQDVDLYVAKLASGKTIIYETQPQRHLWIQIIEGDLSVNDQRLHTGDAAAVSDGQTVTLQANEDSHFLLFDLA